MARKPDYRKKVAIIRIATELFAKRGYQNTSIEEIAEESGYAVGTIYLYFDSKEEIMSDMLNDFVENFAFTYMLEIEKIANPVDRFKFIIKSFLTASEENPDRVVVIATELRKVVRTENQMFKGVINKLLDILQDSLKDLQKAGIIKKESDLYQLTIFVFGTIETMSIWWTSTPDKKPVGEFAEYVVNLVLNGIGKK